MRFSAFILTNLEPILADWEKFARTLLPASHGMSPEHLRDHARAMLDTIARDLATGQSGSEQRLKSEGHKARKSASDSAAEEHADDRVDQGFSLNEVVAEYRALRASVIRLWTSEMGEADRSTLDELTRFNEALDQAITESVVRYTAQVDRARDLLLGALGHDLRNPLSAVVHSAQFLVRAKGLPDAQTQAATRILHSGARMQAMIRDLLDFARTRLGDPMALALADTDLGQISRDVIEELKAFHFDRTIALTCTGNLRGSWDASRAGQLLSNLVGNAIEHGSVDTSIRVTAFGSDDGAGLTVQNEGPPIPLNQRHRIFEPLARGISAPPGIASGGRNLGLGLYIACQIAQAHGGTLELTSSDETGTTFTAFLPRGLPAN